MIRLKEERSSLPPTAVLVGLMVLAACLAALGAPPAWALGTPAGTIIHNTAQVTYSLSGQSTSLSITATHSFTVEEIIDCSLNWQDAGAVPVSTPQGEPFLCFLLTNTGNGPERFSLEVANVLGTDFDPLTPGIWLESNGTPGLQTEGATPDTHYVPGANDPLLAPDGEARLYVAAHIPAGLNDGDIGALRLSARALTSGAAGAPAGTHLPGAGDGGRDAVVGFTQAVGAAEGRYAVTALAVTLNKTILDIADPRGGTQPYPGARVTYRIAAGVTGTGTVEGLRISDPIPAGMSYVPQSLRLDGAALTDAADAPADGGDFNITAPDTVTIDLGDVVAPAAFLIEFETTINIH
jgi:uncharacterized repeat protein (TIGR01451 family)